MPRCLRYGIAWVARLLAVAAALSTSSSGHAQHAGPYRMVIPPGLDLFVPAPDDNPLTFAKIELGRQLFFDAILSRDVTRACASCHQPELAFADTVRASTGVGGRSPARNTPSLLNRAYVRSLFWDGRAASLEEAVLQPVRNPLELDLALDDAASRLAADSAYRASFEAAFDDGVTQENLARALAAYIRTLMSADAPADRFANGDTTALSPLARHGRTMFLGKANCAACHAGPLLTDDRFHNTGVSWGAEDLGRYHITGDAADRGKFRTPSLRNIALTAPYMHDGSLRTLQEVIEFYSQGGRPNPNLDRHIRPISLDSVEVAALRAFLEALTSSRR